MHAPLSPSPSYVPSVRGRQASRSGLWLSRVVDGSVAAFIALVGWSMSLYPGGTFFEPHLQGHAFWQNFLCDLIQAQSLGGAPNALGARLAASGMLALVCGMVALVGLVPVIVEVRGRLMRALFAVGALSCVAVAAVPLLPSDRFGGLHAAAVLGAGIPVTLALIALSMALWRAPHVARWVGLISLALSLCVSASLALYLREVWFGAEALPVVPVLSRLSNLLLLAWLLSLSRAARGQLREPGQSAFDHV